MGNPHYEFDRGRLEGKWDLDLVLSDKTIIITVGMSVFAELLDRPVAEMLRDVIDRQAVLQQAKRAIIVVDEWWLREERLQRLSTIAVGGPAVNVVTDRIANYRPVHSLGNDYPSLHHGRVGHPSRRSQVDAALWGDSAGETAEVVRAFIDRDLERYLEEAWG